MAEGAAMALEDAVVLAECLCGLETIPVALSAFEARRRPRTDWVRIPHQIWLDASDGSLWLGMLHLAITCLLGWLMLVPFVVAGAGIAAATTPLYMPADSVVRTMTRT